MQYKCDFCNDTGSLGQDDYLNCGHCASADDRVALNTFVHSLGVNLTLDERTWAIHQRALAMAPKQEADHINDVVKMVAPAAANGALTDDEGEALADLKKAVLDGAGDEWLLGFIRQIPFAAAGPDAAPKGLELAAEQLAEYCENMGYYNSYVDDVRAALSGAKGN